VTRAEAAGKRRRAEPSTDTLPAAGATVSRNAVSDQAAPARQRILEAAEDLFAADGFDRTATSRIAEAAGVPQGLIFYHFHTKVGLLLELIDNYARTFTGELHTAVEAAFAAAQHHALRVGPAAGTGTPDTDSDVTTRAVSAVWDALNGRLRDHRNVRQIIFQEMTAHPHVHEQAMTLHQQATRLVTTRLEAELGGSASDPVATETVVAAVRLMIGGAVLGFVLYEQGDPQLTAPLLPTLVTRLIEDRGMSAA
jgi:AcrR family transcriptional regulator